MNHSRARVEKKSEVPSRARGPAIGMGLFGRGGAAARNPLNNLLFRHLEKAKVNLESAKE